MSYYNRYEVKLTLIRNQLGTNPVDPAIHDTHILAKQRELITEKGGINAQINKYLDALPITAEKGDAELNKLIDNLEILLGYELTPEQRSPALSPAFRWCWY
jgi:hypothetical protein